MANARTDGSEIVSVTVPATLARYSRRSGRSVENIVRGAIQDFAEGVAELETPTSRLTTQEV